MLNILHYKKDKQSLIKTYYLALIPLILFSIYKNGILLFNNDLINFNKIFIPIYFYFISIFIALIISKIYKEDIKENILISLIIACTISINTNIIIYPILLFILMFIAKYIEIKSKINTTSLIRIGLILGLLLNSYSYLNIAEKLNKFDYNLFDKFIGFNSGGLASSSLLLIIISFLILSGNKFYKKVIPIIASLSYILLSMLIMFITKDFTNITLLLNGSIYFGFVFIAADLYKTPYSKKGMIIYGLIIGVLSSIFSYLNLNYEASFLSILIASTTIPIINKKTDKKYLK